MDVKPVYAPVGDFFKYQPMYRIPFYQRAYSWERLEVEDFVRDLQICYDKRKYSDPVSHFFGQIVCIGDIQGNHQNIALELVDGQQRIATFILLVHALINIYRRIISGEIGIEISLDNQKKILERRIDDLTKRYIVFQKEIKENFQDINVLELSNRDRAFFQQFLKNPDTEPIEKSHIFIKNAYEIIENKILELTTTNNLKDKIGNLKTVEEILETDFCILNMITNDQKAAFKLFQVLNNRGKNLTEGDLLRAECLRMLELHPNEQNSVERTWDNILIDAPHETLVYLRAIYGSYTGRIAGTNSLFNEFLNQFLPEHEHEHIDFHSANRIKDQVQIIADEIQVSRNIFQGIWLYEPRLPVEEWDRKRLNLLINALGHKECLPFLLSAKLLNQSLFSEIVQMLERFVFRYLTIGNQYIGDLITIYFEEAKVLRDSPGTYAIASLRNKLQPLFERVDNEMFKRLLDDFKYTKLGRSNKPLKYFLLSIEYHYRWHKEGAVDQPKCLDKERVYNFDDSTIEHIYPYNGIGTGLLQPNLELVKNTIGNLTILGNEDNRTGDNDDFLTKKPIFESSSLMMNREDIAPHNNWDEEQIQARTRRLKDIACAIFQL